MIKISNRFKETMQEIAVTVVVNAVGAILKSIGESLVKTEKFDRPKSDYSEGVASKAPNAPFCEKYAESSDF